MPKRSPQLDRAIEHAMAEVRRLGSLGKLPSAVRTVLLVHTAQGIIDNGGLQYFFESDFPGQPPYAVFVDAYRASGAEDEADALAAAVKLFPFPDPHKHQRRRDKFLEQFLDDDDGPKPDNPFEPYTDKLCGNRNVWRLLERFVKQHAESFPR